MKSLWLLALVFALGGCSTGYLGQGLELSQKGFHQEATGLFYEELKEQPDSAAAWRELGISFYHLDEFGRAEEALQQAIRIQPDARAHLYLGLVFEQAGDFDLALVTYRTAVQLEPDRKTEKLIRSHIQALVQKRIRKEVDAALAGETDLDTASIPRNTIAVVDFDKSDLPEDLAPLSRGLAEFTALDLTKVQALDVVERAKISTLLNELALSEEGMVDPAARLRIGRLVGSRNLVTGSLQVDGHGGLEIYGAVGNTMEATVTHADPASGALEDFFSIQKDLVFAVIATLGLKLSPEERTAIEAVPTENFLAFMAYCRGLEAEAAGDLEQAAGHYRQAASADAGFSEAKARGQAAGDALEFGAAAMGGDPESFEDAVTSSILEAYQQQLYLIMLAENSQFLPSDIPDVSLGNEDPLIPNTGSAGGVAVTVRGRIDGSR